MSALKKVSESPEATPAFYPWKEQKEKDSKIVKGRFVNREAPGGELTFSLKLYKGDPIKTYTLQDGKEYELPLGVVKHLVKNCQNEETTNDVKLVDPHTYQPLYAKKYTPRFTFVTSEFLE